jgi:hypothetical protein
MLIKPNRSVFFFTVWFFQLFFIRFSRFFSHPKW